MKLRNWLLISAMALTFAACEKKPAEADLVILYTTDTHGALLPWDIKHDAQARTSLANVSTYLKWERALNKDKVLMFDTGDFLQGQPSVYYYNYCDTTSLHVAAAAYNYLQYDALGVGNHDIETGEDVYGRRFKNQLEMPWLAANAIDQRTGQPMFQPYATFERQGVKVAVLGMITPNIHAWLPKSLWPNLEFEDMVECAQKWVTKIREEENPDLLIGLFHSGGDYTMNGSDMDTRFNENGAVPAAIKVPGFDLCLLGHDHQIREMKVANIAGDSVLLIDARTQAQLVGRVDVHMILQGNGTYKKEMKVEMVNMETYAPDEEYAEYMKEYVETSNNFVNSPIGELTADLPGINGLYGPCPFMDLIHDAQLWATKSDISLAAVLSPYEMVPAGAVTMRHLFTLYKYENQLFCVSMTADEVRQYLEYGFASQYNTMKNANDHLMAFRTNDKGEVQMGKGGARLKGVTFNFTSAAGIRYTVDVSKPEGERVKLMSMSDGSAIDPEKLYRVAINSYQYSGGGQFIPEGLKWDEAKLKERTLDTTPIDVRRYIAEYIRQHTPITPHLRGDWKVIPTDWWEKGKARDMKLMNAGQR